MTMTPVRTLTALPLVLAPVIMGAALLTDITPQAQDTRELLELIVREPVGWSMGQTLFFVSAVMWVPAGLLLMRLFGSESRLGRLAAAAVVVGGLAVLPVDAAGLYLRELAASDIPLAQQVRLVESVESSPTLLFFEGVHIGGLFLGLLAVGVAMLSHPNLPRWAGILVLIGTATLVVAPAGPLLAGAVALLIAGLAVPAVRVGRPAPSGRAGQPDGRAQTPSVTGHQV